MSGRVLVDVVRERVLEPVGMSDSGYFRFDEPRPDLAIGYCREGDGWRSNIYDIPVVGGPDGGAFATALDIDRCLRAIASGSLLGPDLRAAMLTGHVPVGDGVAMGYGVFLRPDGSFGHGGGDPGSRPTRDTSPPPAPRPCCCATPTRASVTRGISCSVR